MFSGPVVWRGIIYAILMVLGKTLCGAWLVRFPASARSLFGGVCSSASRTARILIQSIKTGRFVHLKAQKKGLGEETRVREDQEAPTKQTMTSTMPNGQTSEVSSQLTAVTAASRPASQSKKPSSQSRKPLSLYPAGIVSCAMVARGEIGFLISSVAESKGIFRRSSGSSPSGPDEVEEASEIFLIITWAIVLCTILGPLCVGLLVRRVKRLEGRNSAPGQAERDKKNVLGVWCVT